MTKEMLLLSLPFAYSGKFSLCKKHQFGSSGNSHHKPIKKADYEKKRALNRTLGDPFSSRRICSSNAYKNKDILLYAL